MKRFMNLVSDSGSFMLEEIRRIITDPGAVLIFIFAVIAYPVIYSIAYQGEVLHNLPVAVVDRSNTSVSRTLSRMVDETDELEVTVQPADIKEAEKMFYDGTVKGILLIESNFQEHILIKKPAIVKLYADGSYFLFYKQVLSGTLYSSGTLSAGVEIQRLMASGQHKEQAMVNRDPVPLLTRELHNPYGGYGSFVMPGLMVVILQQTLLVGLGMMGGTSAESKKSHFPVRYENNKSTVFSYIFGRAGAYLLLYLLTGTFVLIWVHHWFGFPENGTAWKVLVLYIPFILSVTFLGMAVAALFKRREEAFLILVFFSPIVLFLSGISWPPEAIPHILYSLGHLVPSSFMMPAYLRVRTMGASLPDVSYELTGLLIQTAVYFVLAVWITAIQMRRRENQVVALKEIA